MDLRERKMLVENELFARISNYYDKNMDGSYVYKSAKDRKLLSMDCIFNYCIERNFDVDEVYEVVKQKYDLGIDIEQEKFIRRVLIYHECDDKEKREQYVREEFDKYCSKNNIDKSVAIDLVMDRIKWKKKQKNTVSKFEHFDNIKDIIEER